MGRIDRVVSDHAYYTIQPQRLAAMRQRFQAVTIPMAPGDGLFFHGNAVHSAHANRSTTRHRPAFAMVLKGVSCRRDEEGFARYMAAAEAQRKAMNR